MPRYKRFQPVEKPLETSVTVFAPPVEDEAPAAVKVPEDWSLGALLKVRMTGAGATVTLYPEEASWEHPERAIQFTNIGILQDFVSRWYARQHHDPRA